MKKKPVKKISEETKFVMRMSREDRMKLEDEISELQIKIQNLQHQIIGFRAVISYLEDLAGVRSSQ